MFEIKLQDMDSPRKMTQSVLQAAELLGMYQAELARVLHCNCADIGELANARALLQPATLSWTQAEKFIDFFAMLYAVKGGDGIAMFHWLRADHQQLGGVPLLLMVDEQGLDKVLAWLKQSLSMLANQPTRP